MVWPSLEPSWQNGSNEGSQDMFYVEILKIVPQLSLLPLLIWSTVIMSPVLMQGKRKNDHHYHRLSEHLNLHAVHRFIYFSYFYIKHCISCLFCSCIIVFKIGMVGNCSERLI